MELLEFKKNPRACATAKKNLNIARFFPRAHLLMAGALTVALIILASLPSEPAQAFRQSVQLSLPTLPETPEAQLIATDPYIREAIQASKLGVSIIEEKVKPGDNLSLIFQRAGLSDKDMFALVNSSKQAKGLAQIFPGHTLKFEIDANQQLLSLTHRTDKLHANLFRYQDNTYIYSEETKAPDVKLAVRSGIISSSLYNAGVDAGLNEQLIMELAGIFGWDVDFALDIRSGDQFRLVFEEKFLEGEPIGVGNILAAEFINQNTSFKAVRYVNAAGDVQYYSPSGNAMQKAFLRAPLDFRRISSNFNPRRLHPVTKTVRPHRGTDYAANRGTPVWASGDGRVIASGYTSTNGNYIVIQHGGEIQTKYLHLTKRMVKKGARVKQKQIIGTVGTTGLSTAPHLHYEFLLNGVHRNPRTIVQKLPKAKSIAREEMQRFIAQTQPLVAELEKTTQLAATKTSTTKL